MWKTKAATMKSKENTPKTLHLVLKSKWYDKIASGEKTSEYRVCSNYWNKRFCRNAPYYYCGTNIIPTEKSECHLYSDVIFHRGYTNETMQFKIVSIKVLVNEPNDLGAAWCWEIKLGQRM